MKKNLFWLLMLNIITQSALLAQETVIPASNRSTANLEKNILFYATTRYLVSQSGSISLPLANLFDGSYVPQYSTAGIDPANPYVVTIENLPNVNVQAGAWVGWTTRYYAATNFKIEAYNTYDYGGLSGYPAVNTWFTVATVTNYTGSSYIVPVTKCNAMKLRFTFYNASGPNNAIGISELFFIHGEAAIAYDAMMVKYDQNGNIPVGTTDAKGYKLAVNGSVIATSMTVKLNQNWPDYVFKKDYQLPSLPEVKTYIDQNHHLPEMPSEAEVSKEGINLGEMNKLLTKKVEELTLYLIEKDKVEKEQQQFNQKLETELNAQKLSNQAQQQEIETLNRQLKVLMGKMQTKQELPQGN